jgi:8-oxo-dGTP pyrophosphatase MutT (NUDIX family)
MKDITGFPLIPLELSIEGLYPFPNTACGVLPCYVENNQLIWGCVQADRVGAIVFSPPGGAQDIIIMRGSERFVIEVGKPLPNLGLEFLTPFVGKSVKEIDYQAIMACLVANHFNVYVESPLAAAIRETQEEHGIDLRSEGKDSHLVNSMLALPPLELQVKRGTLTHLHWVALLKSKEGVVLNHTNKVEQKIKLNLGRPYCEKGIWGTLASLQLKLSEEMAKYPEPEEPDIRYELIKCELETSQRRLALLTNVEVLVTSHLSNSGIAVSANPPTGQLSPLRALSIFEEQKSVLDSALVAHNASAI